MGKAAIERARGWLARTLKMNESAAPENSSGGDAAPEPWILYLSQNLGERSAELRAAVDAISGATGAAPETYERLAREADRLEDLALETAAALASRSSGAELRSFEIEELIRKCRADNLQMKNRSIRARTRQGTPGVAGAEPALPRAFALCLESADMLAAPGAAIFINIEFDGAFVNAAFEPEQSLCLLPPRVRRRIEARVAFAAALARAFGGTVEIVNSPSAFEPRLRMPAADC